MRGRATAIACWHAHINGVNPPRELRHWLGDLTSLTVKLGARCQEFRVRPLRQGRALCLADEAATIGLSVRSVVQEREVLLHCDGRPVVFAHSVVPLVATASDWPFFGRLGARSLGTTLFGDPRVARGTLQFARLGGAHPLLHRIRRTLGQPQPEPLLARRCLYRRRNGMLLVTEVFLAAIAELGRPEPKTGNFCPSANR